MGNAQALASVLGPIYLMLGLSILLYVKSWQKLYKEWSGNHFGLFPLMFLITVFGLVVIQFYNVWEWNVWLLVTLSGWGMFLKGLFYFLFPGSWIKGALKMGQNVSWLYFGGLFAAVWGAVMGYYAYFV